MGGIAVPACRERIGIKKARGGNTIKHNRFANSSFQGRINGMGEICDWLAWSPTAFEIIMLLLLLVGERMDTP